MTGEGEGEFLSERFRVIALKLSAKSFRSEPEAGVFRPKCVETSPVCMVGEPFGVRADAARRRAATAAVRVPLAALLLFGVADNGGVPMLRIVRLEGVCSSTCGEIKCWTCGVFVADGLDLALCGDGYAV